MDCAFNVVSFEDLEKDFAGRFGQNFLRRNIKKSKDLIFFVGYQNVRPDVTINYDVCSPDAPNEVQSAEGCLIRKCGLVNLVKAGYKVAIVLNEDDGAILNIVPVIPFDAVRKMDFIEHMPEELRSGEKVTMYIQNPMADSYTLFNVPNTNRVAKKADQPVYGTMPPMNSGTARYESELTERVRKAFKAKYVDTTLLGQLYSRDATDHDRLNAIQTEVYLFERETNRTAFLDYIEGDDSPVVLSVPNRNDVSRFGKWAEMLAE